MCPPVPPQAMNLGAVLPWPPFHPGPHFIIPALASSYYSNPIR